MAGQGTKKKQRVVQNRIGNGKRVFGITHPQGNKASEVLDQTKKLNGGELGALPSSRPFEGAEATR